MVKNHITLFSDTIKTNNIILYLFLMCALSTSNIYSQVKTISGIVSDEIGDPLPGVSVLETGTLNGESTNFDGKFSIKVKEGSSLTFSYIGYKPVVKIVGKENIISVGLKPDIENLDEIV